MEDNKLPSIEERIQLNEEKLKQSEEAAIARAERQQENITHRNAVDVSWKDIKNNIAIKELITFIETVKEAHVRVATDGVAQKFMGKDEDGNEIMDVVNLSSEQRLGHLDRATGNDEILNYLIRHCS